MNNNQATILFFHCLEAQLETLIQDPGRLNKKHMDFLPDEAKFKTQF
jgi:hypothetical protein